MSVDQSWWDPNTAWCAKLDRAYEHLGSLRQQVDAYRAARPHEVIAEPTDTPGRTAYRVHIRQQVPVRISTTVGDIVHNLRSALDSVAYELAVRHVGRPLSKKEARATEFPVKETPDLFDEFFTDPRVPVRDSLYGSDERVAFRIAQPFGDMEAAGDRDPAEYAKNYRREELRRLNVLSNLDKHRRLAVLGWAHNFPYWPSGGQTNRRWTWGDRRLVDGAVIGYTTGSDPEVGDAMYNVFNLVIEDDPILVSNDDPSLAGQDAVRMLEGWHRYVRVIIEKVFRSL